MSATRAGSARSRGPGAPGQDDATRDDFLRGRLSLWQPRTGYRVSVDSLLLARFVSGGAPRRRAPSGIADLCAGVGVIGLSLALAFPRARVTLAELQPRMAAFARRNIADQDLADRVEVVEVDLADATRTRALLAGARFDLVVASPPYFALAAGPAVPDESEAIARHELRMDLGDLAREARRLLRPEGRAAVVFPSERLPELLAALGAERLRPTRLRMVHPRPEAPAQRVLLEAVKGGRGSLLVEAPLYLRDPGGGYGAEARAALGEDREPADLRLE